MKLEWFAVVVSLCSMAIALGSLAWTIRRDLRNRARVRLTFEFHPSDETVVLVITNVGRESIIFDNVLWHLEGSLPIAAVLPGASLDGGQRCHQGATLDEFADGMTIEGAIATSTTGSVWRASRREVKRINRIVSAHLEAKPSPTVTD